MDRDAESTLSAALEQVAQRLDAGDTLGAAEAAEALGRTVGALEHAARGQSVLDGPACARLGALMLRLERALAQRAQVLSQRRNELADARRSVAAYGRTR